MNGLISLIRYAYDKFEVMISLTVLLALLRGYWLTILVFLFLFFNEFLRSGLHAFLASLLLPSLIFLRLLVGAFMNLGHALSCTHDLFV